VYDGIGGDILSAGLLPKQEHVDLFRAGRLDELAEALLPQAPAVDRCFTADLARRVSRDAPLDRLRKELVRHTGAANPIASFFFWNRTRREISVIFKILHPIEVIAPFLDEDLFFFLSSLPPEITLTARFHTDTILRAYPQYSGVRFETKGGFAHDFRTYQAFALRTVMHIAANPQVRLSYVLPRLLRCAVDPTYAPNVQWLARRTIYHTELRSLAHGPRPSS
ncbi:MAG: hypothetical protein ACREB3_05130, partial [Burkholderiales bacterium]